MKLLSINVGIKIDNAKNIAHYIEEVNPDIIAMQEIARHLDESVSPQFRSKSAIEAVLGSSYPHSFFGPLWIADKVIESGILVEDFGGMVEQGNQFLSKYEMLGGTNEFYYKNYAYHKVWLNLEKEDHGRAVLIAEFDLNGNAIQVLNLHGIWSKDKRDDKRTVSQSEYVLKAALRKNMPTIITGDFNLLPDTESIKILNSEFRNLINEFEIGSTRPEFDDGLDKGNQIVDYVFVNDLIQVNSFHVPSTDISDHLPLILDFDIKK